MADDHTGLLIIRAWLEPGSTQPLHAHLRITSNVANGFERTETLSDVGAVSAEVTAWLREVVGT